MTTTNATTASDPALRGGRLLVATDLTDASTVALKQASAYARALGAALHVCHVVPVVLRNNALLPHRNEPELEGLVALEKKAADAVSARVAEATGRGPDEFVVHVANGEVDEEIVALAEEVRAGLIVLGAGSIASPSFGRVARRVVACAPRAVLLARSGEGPKRVLAATDFSDPSYPAVEHGAEVAGAFGAQLYTLHVVESKTTFFSGLPEAESWLALPTNEVEAARAAAKVHLERCDERFGIRSSHLVEAGEPAGGILRARDHSLADLVVLGARGTSRLRRVAIGSTTETVALEASADVLVVHLEA